MNKTYKRIISIVIAVIMMGSIAVMFSGCGDGYTSDPVYYACIKNGELKCLVTLYHFSGDKKSSDYKGRYAVSIILYDTVSTKIHGCYSSYIHYKDLDFDSKDKHLKHSDIKEGRFKSLIIKKNLFPVGNDNIAWDSYFVSLYLESGNGFFKEGSKVRLDIYDTLDTIDMLTTGSVYEHVDSCILTAYKA